tara:strand:- start:2825 stop:3010 length:186 start_codon:yes stop_codon:yes gene_type:complete
MTINPKIPENNPIIIKDKPVKKPIIAAEPTKNSKYLLGSISRRLKAICQSGNRSIFYTLND